jgi:hypothetical protein
MLMVMLIATTILIPTMRLPIMLIALLMAMLIAMLISMLIAMLNCYNDVNS